MKTDLLETIRLMIEPIANKLELDLVDLNLNRRGKAIVVDVIADKPLGGITMDECTLLNRELSEELEGQDIISEEYIVEVSSPGLDRPLKTQKDFNRVMNRDIRFHLTEMVDGKLEYQGKLKEIIEDSVILETPKQTVEISYSQIQKAIQVI